MKYCPYALLLSLALRDYLTYFVAMPSHLAHDVFAAEVLASEAELSPELFQAARIVGAQLPDLWYHNRRTRPSGLWISVALHRQGMASFVSELLVRAAVLPTHHGSIIKTLAYAVLSHAVLDRHLHPWINAYSSWESTEDAQSARFRYRHAMCERFVDLYLLRKLGHKMELVHDFGRSFARALEVIEGSGVDLKGILRACLFSIYPKKQQDTETDLRLQNGFSDARGFYSWSSELAPPQYEADLRESALAYRHLYHGSSDRTSEGWAHDPELHLRFSAIIHPRFSPTALDLLEKLLDNSAQTLWFDPCTDEAGSSAGVLDLYASAKKDVQQLFGVLKPQLDQVPFLEAASEARINPDADRVQAWIALQSIIVQQALGDAGFHNGDLRSRPLSSHPCTIQRCNPLDWIALRLQWEGFLTETLELPNPQQ